MAINETERGELGALIQARRERKFGTKRAAYQEAGVNAATWDKAEAGDSVRPDLLRRIVRLLWPETEGDWAAVVGDSSAPSGPTITELADRMAAMEERLAELFREQRSQPEDEKEGGGAASA